MLAFLAAVSEALGWGIWTAVQPCPMATNIAAISFIGRRVGNAWQVLLAGLLYALGRTITYVLLAALLIGGIQATPLSSFLQQRMSQLLGPLLIVMGMFLLDLIQWSWSGPNVSQQMQKRIEAWGVWAALPLGIVFAAAFCPLSAWVFFFSVLRLLMQYESRVLLPGVYGIGTALPVVGFAVLIAFSAQMVGRAFNVVAKIEWWFRRIAGSLFIAIGIHFSLKYIFEIKPFWDPWLDAVYNLMRQTT